MEEIKGKAPKGKLIPLEPSYWNLLENPFHKSPRSTRAGFQAGRLELGDADAKVSKSSHWVNNKFAEFVRQSSSGKIADIGEN